MEFLRLLESIRSPFLDTFMLLITKLGEETFFIIIAMVYLWCVDKFDAYYLLFVGFCGTQLNQLLKTSFKIPRPWVRDPSLTPVASAIPEATGYSFPSGHTQSAVGTLGTVGATAKNKFIKIIAPILFVLVAFSRMYLGVHTPADVAVSFGIGLLLVIIFGIIFKRCPKNEKTMHIIFAVLIPLFTAQAIYLSLTLDITNTELLSALKTTYKMLGSLLGMLVVFELDRKYIKFETKASLPVQIIKVILGLALSLLVKEVCYLIFGFIPYEPLSRALSYFVMVLFAGAAWPAAFPLLNKIKLFNK